MTPLVPIVLIVIVVFVVVAIVLAMYYQPANSAIQTETSPSCKRLIGYRLPGGGYQQGNDADHILPYPYHGSSVDDCENNCKNNPLCKQYVSTPDGTSCYQMNQTYAYTDVNKDDAFVSGICTR